MGSLVNYGGVSCRVIRGEEPGQRWPSRRCHKWSERRRSPRGDYGISRRRVKLHAKVSRDRAVAVMQVVMWPHSPTFLSFSPHSLPSNPAASPLSCGKVCVCVWMRDRTFECSVFSLHTSPCACRAQKASPPPLVAHQVLVFYYWSSFQNVLQVIRIKYI